MNNYVETIAMVSPIFILIIVGFILKKTSLLTDPVVAGIKKLVINLALPSTIFLAFASVELESRYLLVFLIVFGICSFMLFIGYWLKKVFKIESPYFPALLTGFEVGMMGYSMYSVAFGSETIYKVAVVDFGQVTFVFLVVATILLRMRDGKSANYNPFLSFLKSPPIIGVLTGITASLLGLNKLSESNIIVGAAFETVRYIASLVVPLILLTIGYDLHLTKKGIKEAAITVLFRTIFLLPIALLGAKLMISGLLGLDKGFEMAFITIMILPAPFVIPIFTREDDRQSNEYIANTLSLNVLVTLVVYVLLLILL